MFAKIGTAEVATDPMPPNVADSFVMLKPRARVAGPARSRRPSWSRRSRSASTTMPGNNYEFTQPIQMRFNELISGVRSDVGVKVFGDDLDTLLQVAGAGAGGAAARPGRGRREGRAGRRPAGADRQAQPRRRWRATASASPTCRTIVEIAVGGKSAGHGVRGRPALRPRGAPAGASARRHRGARGAADPAAGGDGSAATSRSRLAALAAGAGRATCRSSRSREIEIAPGPNQISRENGKRRVVVTRQRARARPRLLRRRGAARRSPSRSSCRPATGSAGAASSSSCVSATRAADDRRAGGAAADLRAAVHEPSASSSDALLVFTGVPLALTGGMLALLAARHPALDLAPASASSRCRASRCSTAW